MIIRQLQIRSLPPPLLQFLASNPQSRCIHETALTRRQKPQPPPPTPFVPDTKTFLTLIGRQMSKFSSKFPTWESLFMPSSPELRDMGIEPARSRRYLLRWREKFRKGEFGIGGDLKHVVDGIGEIRVIEVPRPGGGFEGASATSSPGMRKMIVNVPAGALRPSEPVEDLQKVGHVKIYSGNRIKGSHVVPMKGSNFMAAMIQVKEGLWEHKQGRKVDGGERRQAEVRAKKRSEEKKNERA